MNIFLTYLKSFLKRSKIFLTFYFNLNKKTVKFPKISEEDLETLKQQKRDLKIKKIL
jgi:hypothetical protein